MPIIPILDGLQQGLTAATTGAIPPRTVTVLNRDPDGQYEGPFPMVLTLPLDDTYAIVGNAGLGQPDGHPSLYSCVIFDRVQKKAGATGLVAASQTDVFTLIDRIVSYFSFKANMALPNQSAKAAGVLVRFRFDPYGMYKRTEAGVGPVAVGVIGVIGPLLGDGA